MKLQTIQSLYAVWKEDVRPAVVRQYSETDEPALSESWNQFTDAACKEGQITGLQYHYCPADDAPMPDSSDLLDEVDWLLERLEIKADASELQDRVWNEQPIPELDGISADWKADILAMLD